MVAPGSGGTCGSTTGTGAPCLASLRLTRYGHDLAARIELDGRAELERFQARAHPGCDALEFNAYRSFCWPARVACWRGFASNGRAPGGAPFGGASGELPHLLTFDPNKSSRPTSRGSGQTGGVMMVGIHGARLVLEPRCARSLRSRRAPRGVAHAAHLPRRSRGRGGGRAVRRAVDALRGRVFIETPQGQVQATHPQRARPGRGPAPLPPRSSGVAALRPGQRHAGRGLAACAGTRGSSRGRAAQSSEPASRAADGRRNAGAGSSSSRRPAAARGAGGRPVTTPRPR